MKDQKRVPFVTQFPRGQVERVGLRYEGLCCGNALAPNACCVASAAYNVMARASCAGPMLELGAALLAAYKICSPFHFLH